ncbi:hypothetical protein K438DRAFT_1931788 [Mycena galopus ATCC 62051]|nr:hypothetical protein K438DRAFT_1931788 [Mycena galopus ATCC 62051]
MCDTSNTLSSSALSSTVFLIPTKILPYLSLGLVSAAFIVYALHYYCPSARLNRLHNTITTVDELLDHAKATCRRDFLALAELDTRFLRLHTRLLEVQNVPDFRYYVQPMMDVSRSLPKLCRELQDVYMLLRVLIEAERQQKLTEDIKEGQESIDGVLRSQNAWRARVQRQTPYDV